MPTIEPLNLIWIFAPALLVVFVQIRWSLNAKKTLYAIARMLLQLLAIGYLLNFLFSNEAVILVSLVLSVMLLAASWISLSPIDYQERKYYFLKSLIAISLVNGTLLLIIVGLVLQTPNWYQANVVVPLAGMVFACGMTTISLFLERFLAERTKQNTITQARNIAFNATMIPTLNALFAVGLVSLPGMMTGQILSGVSPLIAVRYQIMIMLMLLASTGLTTALFYLLIEKRHHSPE